VHDKFTVAVSCGALDYYNAIDFSTILRNLTELANNVIFETNIQSPETPAVKGTFVPSIDQIYQILYTLALYDGKSRVNVSLIKKYTSIWRIIRES
jgi:hypothetical protein